MADRSDEELLRDHVAGDPDAFALLFSRHRDRLWAVAMRTCGDREDAADALQQALISAHRKAPAFRGDSSVTTWWHRIVVNACLDKMRRNKVRAAEPLPEDLDRRFEAGTGDPVEHAIQQERRRHVLSALEKLPHDQKVALILVDMQGYPVREAAEILQVPPGTVKSRCARGRSKLAGLLPRTLWADGTTALDDASDQLQSGASGIGAQQPDAHIHGQSKGGGQE